MTFSKTPFIQEQQNLNRTADRRFRIMEHHKINKVLDVGASIGQYGSQLRFSGYRGQIISFEPLLKPFERLRTVSMRDGNWRAFQLALGNEDTEAKINISANSYSSSILPILERHLLNAPESRLVGHEDVIVRRLDTVANDFTHRDDKILVKIDTQGYEHLVIEGMAGILDLVHLIECELSLSPLYQGQKLFTDIIKILEPLGFVAVDFARGFSDLQSGYCLQVDGIFARRDSKIPVDM